MLNHHHNLKPTIPQIAQTLPVIAGVEITTDADGRFNLNALHRASGEADHKRPSKWLASGPAQDLIGELEAQSPQKGFGAINTIRGGNAAGTFAHELIAISYAGWISPGFQLKVNQVFLDYRAGKLAPVASPFEGAALSREVRLQTRMFAKMAKDMGLSGNQAMLSVCRGVETMTGVNPMAAMGLTHIEAEQNDDLLNVTELGNLIGVKAQEMNMKLIGRGLQTTYRDTKGNKKYELTEEGSAAGGRWTDTQKAQGGRPIRQLMWPSTVAELFRGGATA